MDLGTLMTTFGADLDPLQRAVGLAQVEFEKYKKAGGSAFNEVDTAAKQSAAGIDFVTKAVVGLTAAFSAVKIVDFVKEITLAAARYETLGVVMTVVGKTANYTGVEMEKFSQALMKTGISMTESRSNITKMTQAHLDLTKSTELARIAQDAAVIGNINSSDAFAHMVYGIQSAQVEVLRTIGINVSFEESYKTLSAQLGKTSNELTQAEKSTARMNAVLEQGKTIAGVYEAAMGTAQKQILSMKRYMDDLKVSAGQAFTPALTEIVTAITEKFKEASKYLKDNKDDIEKWGIEFAWRVGDAIKLMDTLLPVVGNLAIEFAALAAANKIAAMFTAINTATIGLTASLNALNIAAKANIVIAGSMAVGAAVTFLKDQVENTREAANQTDILSDRMKVLQSIAEKGGIGTLYKPEQVQKLISGMETYKNTLEKEKAAIESVLSKQPLDTEYQEKLAAINKELTSVNTTTLAYKDSLITQRTAQLGSTSASENALSPLRQQLEAKDALVKMQIPYLKEKQDLDAYLETVKKAPAYQAAMTAADQDSMDLILKTEEANWKKEHSVAAVEKAEKSAAKEAESARKKAIADAEKYEALLRTQEAAAIAYNQVMDDLHSKIAAFKGDTYASEIAKIEKEFEQFAKKTGVANAELIQWNELVRGAAGFASIFEVTPAGKTSTYPDDPEKRALEIAQAYRSMYTDMGKSSNEYFAGEYTLLKQQAARYKQMGLDVDAVNQWLWNEEKKINDKRILAGDDFFAGMRVGYEELQKDAMTWAKAGQKTIKDFASQGSRSLSDGLFDVITGQMESLEDAWKSLWQGMLKTVLDTISQMAVNEFIKFVFNGTSTGSGITIGTGSTGTSSGAGGAIGAAGTGLSLISLAKTLYNLPETLTSAYGTVAGWFAEDTVMLSESVAELMEAYGYGAELTAEIAQESAQIIADASAELATTTAEVGAEVAAEGASSAAAGSLAAYGAGALFAVMQFVASDTFRNLYYGGTKTSYEVLREDERTGYAQLDPEMRDWLKADLLLDDANSMNLKFVVKDLDSFVASHKELLSMTMDKFDYLIGEQASFYAAAVDTSGTMSNTLAGFTLNYDTDAAVKLAVDIANDTALTLEEKMYQLGFVATASGGWETEAVVAMIAELSNDGVPWSQIQKTMGTYGIATDGQSWYGASEYGMGGMASGGQYGDDPFIVGEKGWEIVNPRNKTVLSHEQSLKAMGMKGYADGTDPFLDLIGMANNAGDVGAPTSTTASGSSMTWEEFWADYKTEATKLLGLNTELGDSLAEINTKYDEQIKQATELNATAEDLAFMEAVRLEARKNLIEDWARSEVAYYNEMMGLNTDLGDSLSEIADHYRDAIENASAAGATQEDLDAILAAGMAVSQKAVDVWAAGMYDYYNATMGYTGSLESALQSNSKQWEQFIQEAIDSGSTVEQLTLLYEAQAETTARIISEWSKNMIEPMLNVLLSLNSWASNIAGITASATALNELMIYRSAHGFSDRGASDIWNVKGMNSDDVKDYVGALSSYFSALTQGLEATYTALNNSRDAITKTRTEIMLGGMTDQEQSAYYANKAISGYYGISKLSSEDVAAAMDQVYSDLMSFYDIEKKVIKDRYQTEVDALNEKHDVELKNIEEIIAISESVQAKLLSIRYGGFNLALPGAKAASATTDYNKMFAAAQTGDADAVSKYLSFTDTALQASMEANKSSQTYLDFYAKVMGDIASLDTYGGQSIEALTQTQTDEITRLNDSMTNDLAALDESVNVALSAMSITLESRIQSTTNELVNIYYLLASYVTWAYSQPQTTGVRGYADGGVSMSKELAWVSENGPEAHIPLNGGAVPVKMSGGGMGDPEIKNLLTALVAQGSKERKVTLTIEGGKSFQAYIRTEADTLDDIRQTRGVKGRVYK
jgi:hypothetical protein